MKTLIQFIKEKVDMTKPGWMLKADPELAKKIQAKKDLEKKRQDSYGDPSKGISVRKEENDLDEPDEQNHATSRNGTELLQHRNGDWRIRRGDGKVIHNGTEKSAKQLWKQLFSSKTGARN
jgi:hypothetical protein